MASREAAHINHARRPPAQTELGPLFSFPFQGYVPYCRRRQNGTKTPRIVLHWVAQSAQYPGHFHTRHERKTTVPSRATSG